MPFICFLREKARKVPKRKVPKRKVSTNRDTELGFLSCGLFGGVAVAGINFVLLNLGKRIQM